MGIIHTSLVGSLRNRSAVFYNFAANATNQTVTLSGLSGYKTATTCVFITINPGLYIYSTSTATPALTITGSTTGDRVRIVNQGYIMGMGGTGASGLSLPANGGNAISVSLPTTIDNTYSTAYIGGGGGGGGGYGAHTNAGGPAGSGGGGAGGGAGGNAIYSGFPAGTGGAGGAIGQSGASAADVNSAGNIAGGGKGGGAGGGAGYNTTGSCGTGCGQSGGGGGGRIFPGVGGAAGVHSGTCSGTGGYAGGSGNNAGGGTATGNPASGAAGGGGWGASGGASSNAIIVGCCGSVAGYNVQLGGTGGKAVALNGNSITWVNGCTARVYGSVS